MTSVLLVEADTRSREATSLSLRRYGYEVHVAGLLQRIRAESRTPVLLISVTCGSTRQA